MRRKICFKNSVSPLHMGKEGGGGKDKLVPIFSHVVLSLLTFLPSFLPINNFIKTAKECTMPKIKATRKGEMEKEKRKR